MGTTVKRCTLGLDIGGTKIKALAYETPDKILAEWETPSDANETPEAVRTSIRRCVSHFKGQGFKFQSVGLGCAGSIDSARGVVRNSPNFRGWDHVPLKSWVEEDSGLPAIVDNDANCAAYAEWKLGKGVGTKNMVLLTLGTGLGAGLVLNGQLFRGSTGTGGELGHLSIKFDGIECPCGNRGCFERYISATAVHREANGASSKDVFTNAAHNPEYAKVVSDFIERFSIGLVSLANTFDPDIILLGGAVSYGVESHLDQIRATVKRRAFPAVANHMKIESAKFGNFSGSLGAALLATDL